MKSSHFAELDTVTYPWGLHGPRKIHDANDIPLPKGERPELATGWHELRDGTWSWFTWRAMGRIQCNGHAYDRTPNNRDVARREAVRLATVLGMAERSAWEAP